MSQAVLFDTHALIKKLRDSGFEERQAEALTDAFKDAQEAAMEELATKGDIKDLRNELKGDITGLRNELKGDSSELRHEINLLKWMMGFILAGILSLVLKAFFIF